MNKTASDQPRRKMGRPSVAQSQQLDELVKASALDLFLDHGYDGVSMEAVAKAAGITKRSLYARYSDKGELFVDALKFSKHAWQFDTSKIIFDPEGTLEEALLQLGAALMAQALDPKYIKVGRMAAAVADHFPEVVKKSYDIGLSPRLQSIREVLLAYQDQMAETYARELDLVAELFLGLVSGLPARLASFGMIREAELEQHRVELAVKMFISGIAREP